MMDETRTRTGPRTAFILSFRLSAAAQPRSGPCSLTEPANNNLQIKEITKSRFGVKQHHRISCSKLGDPLGKMSPTYRSNARITGNGKISAVLLALILVFFVSGCKKKVPPPPPPPPPAPAAVTPPPPPARPEITAFTVEPSAIERGQSATLRWAVTNSTDTSINQGIGAVQSQGQRQVSPTQTTTYTVTATGPGGTANRRVPLN